MARHANDHMPEEHIAEPGNLPEVVKAADERRLRTHEVEERFGDGLPYDRNRYLDKCRYHMMRSAEEALEVGRALLVMKEHEQHGEFLKCVDNLGIERTVAKRMMKASLKFSNGALTHHLIEAAQSKTKLFELMLLDDEDLEELSEGGSVAGYTMDDVSRATTSELRAMIRKMKADHAQQIEDLKADQDAQRKLIASKNEKIDELTTKLEKKKFEPPMPLTLDCIQDLQNETIAIVSRLQASFVGRANAVIDAHGPEGLEHAKLLVAQALGQIVSAARLVAGDFDVLPAEDARSVFAEAAGDDERAIWDQINAELAERGGEADQPGRSDEIDEEVLGWLTAPVTDPNFRANLDRANVATLRAALSQVQTKTGRERIEARLRKLEKGVELEG
jgi:hypothetical protein